MSITRIDPSDFDSASSTGPAAEVRRIAEACDATDGVITLNEQACLQLKYRGLRDAALWLGDGGFALVHGQLLDLAVHPDSRGRGTGTALAAAALEHLAATVGKVEAWSHAHHPGAEAIAARFAIPKERELLIMKRPTSLPVELPTPAPGVSVRTFEPADAEALLAINAAAFAHHPEQGHMTLEDFTERTHESWFDPAGLFLAVDDADGSLLGFHWTKVHRDENPPYGEVYVVAANPKAAGRGLGSLLTAVGLRHLAATGVGEVLLYVDADNLPAVSLYDHYGFSSTWREVQYRGKVTVPATDG